MNEEKKEKIWEEIREVIETTYQARRMEDRLPGEKSVSELMEFFGLRRDATINRLEWLVKNGTLLKRKGRYSAILYRPNPDANTGSTKPQAE